MFALEREQLVLSPHTRKQLRDVLDLLRTFGQRAHAMVSVRRALSPARSVIWRICAPDG